MLMSKEKMIFLTARNYWVLDTQYVGPAVLIPFFYHYSSLRRCPVLEGTEKGVQQAERPKSRYERNSLTIILARNVVMIPQQSSEVWEQ